MGQTKERRGERIPELRPGQYAEHQRRGEARHQAQQDRIEADISLAPHGGAEHRTQGDESHQRRAPVQGITRPGVAKESRTTDRDQLDSDHRHHQPGDLGGKQAAQPADAIGRWRPQRGRRGW